MARVQESAVVWRDGTTAIVTDMDLAIYLYMEDPCGPGLEVVDAVRIGRGRHELLFHDPARVVRYEQLRFTNGKAAGPFRDWARAQRDFKKVIRKLVKRKERRTHARTGKGRGV